MKANGRWVILWQKMCGWMILCTLASCGLMDGWIYRWRKEGHNTDGWMDDGYLRIKLETLFRVVDVCNLKKLMKKKSHGVN